MVKIIETGEHKKQKKPQMKKFSSLIYRVLISVFFFIMVPAHLNAQTRHPHDTTYYTTYPGSLTTRIYLSKKYTSVTLPSSDDHTTDIKYKTNDKLSLGIGATYHNFSLNIGTSFGFLNPDEGKGTSKSIGLQLHLYPYKWAVDALVIFNKGHYLSPEGYATNDPNTYYLRPDIKLNIAGVSAYRVPNAEKFSYHAAMIQNEWQKRSAGSLLYGGQAYFGLVKGDSALVPPQIEKSFGQAGVNHLKFFTGGAGLGYAYTWVIAKHFFIMGSGVMNVDLNYASESGTTFSGNKVSVTAFPVFKTAIGYNSDKWDISANWAGTVLWVGAASTAENYFFQTGNYRLIVARRVYLRKHK